MFGAAGDRWGCKDGDIERDLAKACNVDNVEREKGKFETTGWERLEIL